MDRSGFEGGSDPDDSEPRFGFERRAEEERGRLDTDDLEEAADFVYGDDIALEIEDDIENQGLNPLVGSMALVLCVAPIALAWVRFGWDIARLLIVPCVLLFLYFHWVVRPSHRSLHRRPESTGEAMGELDDGDRLAGLLSAGDDTGVDGGSGDTS
jgi:hypothetical protein